MVISAASAASAAAEYRAQTHASRVPPEPTESPWTLKVLGDPKLEVVAYGDPEPQGSKTIAYRRDGTAYVREDNPDLEQWRNTVMAALKPLQMRGFQPLDGDLIADMVFSLRRPSQCPKRLRARPNKKPDMDKLLRSTGDALERMKMIVNDSRIVGYRRPEKIYVADPDPDALPIPGAVIRLWTVPRERVPSVRKRRGTHALP